MNYTIFLGFVSLVSFFFADLCNGKPPLYISSQILVAIGGGFKHVFIFTPNPGEIIQFDYNIFEMS